MCGRRYKVEYEKFQVNVRKNIFHYGGREHQGRYQNEFETSVFGHIQNLTDQSPEKAVINEHALRWDTELGDL